MNNNQSEFIDIKDLLQKCRSKWYLIVLSGVVFGLFGLLYTLLLQPKYEVKASMQLQDTHNFSAMISGGLSGVADFLGGNVDGEDEVTIATSHSVLSQVCLQLGINKMHYKRLRPLVYQIQYPKYPIDVVPGPDMLVDTLRSQIMFKVSVNKAKRADVLIMAGGNEIYSADDKTLPLSAVTDWGTFVITPTEHFDKVEATKYKITLTSPSLAAVELREIINVGLAAKNSNIIEFQMFSPNVKYAVDIVNTIMAKYMLRAENQLLAENNSMARFLEKRIAQASESLQKTEQEIVSTRSRKALASLAMGGQTFGERLAKAEADMQQRQMGLEMTKLTIELVQAAAADKGLIPLQGDNATIGALITPYNNAVMRRLQMENSAKPDNAALIRLDEQIEEMRDNILSTLQVSLKQSQEAFDKYMGIYNAIMTEVGDIPAYEYDAHAIYRTREIEEQIYVFLLQKQEETAMLLSRLDGSALVIDPAYSPYEDMTTKPVIIIFAAVICGMLIPPVWFYFRRNAQYPAMRKPEEDDEDED